MTASTPERSGPVFVRKAMISHDAVLTALDAAVAEATRIGVELSFAVADSAGRPCGFVRMNQAMVVSGDMAIKKACSAAGLNLETEQAEQILMHENPRVREGLLLQPNFSLVRGGFPIRIEGELIGAIGASGGSEEQDSVCAQAGLMAVIAGAKTE